MATEETTLTEEQQEKLVYGYVRDQYKQCACLMNLIMPISIINLFVTWYKCCADKWHIGESSSDLYIKDRYLMNQIDSKQWFNAFGTQIICNGEKKIWKLRINSNVKPKSSIISARIGIIDASQVKIDKDIQSFQFIQLIMKRNSSRKHGSFDQDFVGSSAISGVSGNFWFG